MSDALTEDDLCDIEFRLSVVIDPEYEGSAIAWEYEGDVFDAVPKLVAEIRRLRAELAMLGGDTK